MIAYYCIICLQQSHISARGYPDSLDELAVHIDQPQFPAAFRRFLWEQKNPDSIVDPNTVLLSDCPNFGGNIRVHHSAVARFYSPSDVCGAGGMLHERIRSTPLWLGEYPWCDTVFVEVNANLPGMQGMVIARVIMFFSFKESGFWCPCALVEWLTHVSNEPDSETGMWMVKPEFEGNQRSLAVVHLNCVARGAHLLPVYGST